MRTECDLVLEFETYEEGHLVECIATYFLESDADPYQVGCREVWSKYYYIEDISLSFHYAERPVEEMPDGTTWRRIIDYFPTESELRDWKDEIEWAIERDAKKNIEKIA
jgi:hypothetical protein